MDLGTRVQFPPPPLKAHLGEIPSGLCCLMAMEQRIIELEARVRDLKARLKLNSTNSSKPPAPPSGKERGGQPGHRKAHRALAPPEKIHETYHCKPASCRRCGRGLSGEDPEPLIHQVAELPKIEPSVDEPGAVA